MVAGSGRFVRKSPAAASCGAASIDGAAVAVHVVMEAHCPGAQGTRQPSDVPEASHPLGVEEAPEGSGDSVERTDDSRLAVWVE
jgi:hypothetical protein